MNACQISILLYVAFLFSPVIIAMAGIGVYWRDTTSQSFRATMMMIAEIAVHLGLIYSNALNPMKGFAPSLEGMVDHSLYFISAVGVILVSWGLIRCRLKLCVVLAALNALFIGLTVLKLWHDVYA